MSLTTKNDAKQSLLAPLLVMSKKDNKPFVTPMNKVCKQFTFESSMNSPAVNNTGVNDVDEEEREEYIREMMKILE